MRSAGETLGKAGLLGLGGAGWGRTGLISYRMQGSPLSDLGITLRGTKLPHGEENNKGQLISQIKVTIPNIPSA